MRLSGMSVFIVEDEALLLMMAEATVRTMGATVVATASNLDDAVRTAENVEADVTLLDVNLLGRMSFPVAETLVSRKRAVVFVTGYAKPDVPPGLARLPVLTKPYDDQRLETTLLATIKTSRSYH